MLRTFDMESVNTWERLQECRQLRPLTVMKADAIETFLQPFNNVKVLLIIGSKGQLISKGNFGVFNSYKKRT